jgi:hypothetical protein
MRGTEAISTPVRQEPDLQREKRDIAMANIKQSLDELLTADGAMCAAVVDSASGMMLGSAGSGVDLEVAAAGNTEVVRAKLKTMRQLGLNDVIDDILITLGKQYHIIRPVSRKEGVFVYFVLDKSKSNLALARRKAQDVERELTL